MKDKETFYYRGSKLKDGFIRSLLLAEAPKTALTKKDIILFEIQNIKGHLTTIAVTPKEAILISNALLSAYTEWDYRELNKKYKKSKEKTRKILKSTIKYARNNYHQHTKP